MKKVIRLTESDLTRIIKKVISESAAEDLKSKLSTTTKKVPGSRSMQYCSQFVSDKTVSQGIKNSCTSEAWGVSCTQYIALLQGNDSIKFTDCTLSCVRDGKYNGVICS